MVFGWSARLSRPLLRGLVMRRVFSVRAALIAVSLSVGLNLGAAPACADSIEPRPVSRTDLTPGTDLRPTLDTEDELAVLDAIHTALSQVGDGNSYVWHRHHGRLSGIMQPTTSFKDQSGQVCRHLVVMLVAGRYVQKTEGIACRLEAGRWQLAG